jgi:putative endonuclease
MNTREKGNRGEDSAVEYLLSNGYSIISRNFQSRGGEIDCIAEAPEGTLVFIEVKTGSSGSYGHPFYRITRGKQRKIISMAQQYLAEHDITNKPCRFDVIAIVNNKIEHLKNAFLR